MNILITTTLMTILFLGCIQDTASKNSDEDSTNNSNKTNTQIVSKDTNNIEKKPEELALEQLELHKKKILEKWEEPEIHTEKIWIEYSSDYYRKTKVDFQKKFITIEVITHRDGNLKSLPNIINTEVYNILTLSTDNATIFDTKSSNSDTTSNNDDKDIESDSNEVDYLVADIFSIDSKQEAKYKSKQIFTTSKITYRGAKNKDNIIITSTFPFPKDGLDLKSKKYRKTMIKHANKNDLPINLIYAIVKIESHFNPMARSRIPAYGLMQIVPRTSGRDITKYLEGRARTLSPKELYNGYNNIKYGSAYLNILYYRYLNKITDPTTRLYCTIAAYNTGTGNVSRVFTGHTNIASASKIINSLTSEEVYDRLITRLPYSETRHYLKTVRSYLYEYEED